jgi:hypothetical protein
MHFINIFCTEGLHLGQQPTDQRFDIRLALQETVQDVEIDPGAVPDSIRGRFSILTASFPRRTADGYEGKRLHCLTQATPPLQQS